MGRQRVAFLIAVRESVYTVFAAGMYRAESTFADIPGFVCRPVIIIIALAPYVSNRRRSAEKRAPR